MKKILIAFSAMTSFSVFAAVYGIDNRVEVFEVNSEIQSLARSTVSLMWKKEFKESDNEWIYKYPNWTLQDVEETRKRERFNNQTTQGFCSGLLISPNEILTAYHCVDENLTEILFTFDYYLHSESVHSYGHPITNVYTAISVKHNVTKKDGYAIVSLDRPVIGRNPLKLSAEKPSVNTNLFMIHYPSGLPGKYSDDAWVKHYTKYYGQEAFAHNLDSFHGSSGAPIFDTETKDVVGILVAGEKDYIRHLLVFKFKTKTYDMFSREKFDIALMVNPEILND